MNWSCPRSARLQAAWSRLCSDYHTGYTKFSIYSLAPAGIEASAPKVYNNRGYNELELPTERPASGCVVQAVLRLSYRVY